MPGITASGVGSGLDIRSLVNQLVAADRAPVETTLSRQQERTQLKLSAYSYLRSSMESLQESLGDDTSGSATDARTATLSSEDFFSADVSDGAALGNYNIVVDRLASSGRSVLQTPTDPAAGLGTGTFDITLGSDSFSIDITDPATTLSDLASAINNAVDNPGVRASILNVDGGSVLSLSSDRTGTDSALTLGGSGDFTAFAADVQAVEVAQDALIYIDGMAVSSSDNVISDAIDGVTLNLTQADPGETINLGVGRNDDAFVDAINRFVEGWNTFADRADAMGSYDPATNTAGELNGNSLLRGIEAQLRAAVSGGQGPSSDLFGVDFGLEIDAKGKMSLDTEAFKEALATRRTDVVAFWSGDDGLAGKVDAVLENQLDSEAALKSRELSLEASLDRIEDRRERLDYRMQRAEDRYLAQFTALDVALAQLQSTGGFLASQLSSLNAQLGQ